MSKNFHTSASHNDMIQVPETEQKAKNTFSIPLIQKIMTSKESIRSAAIASK